MKATTSALLFASVAAAGDYGYGYEAKTTSSSSSSKIGYTTIYPGYGKHPVTVTTQYQPIPTYYPAEYDSSTGSWSEYPYVSTVITDYDGKKTTVTDVEDKVTVYHTKSTITKYTTEYGYAPAPTGYGGYGKNATTTTKAYHELYEKVYEVKYKELGPKALPGYKGSGLWKDDKKQPVQVKEYKDGKWVTKYHVFTYGEPKPSTTKFEKPGVYTLPASDITVDKPYTAPSEATYTAPAGKPVTYGGITTTVTKSTTITAAYPAEETHGDKTKTVIKYKTITCPHAGKYEVAKPTTTSYDHDTTVTYPTVTVYLPGVYHHPKETVTVTKSNQPYTCSYSQTKTYPTYPTTTGSYPTSAYPDDDDSYPTSSSYDPSASYPEPTESYGTPYAGYVKRGGMLERRSGEAAPKKAQAGKRVILV